MSFVTLPMFTARYPSEIPAGDMYRLELALEFACAQVYDVIAADYETITAPNTTPDTPAPVAIVGIVCQMVRRAYDNPDGLQSETVGDYRWSVAAAEAGVYLTPAESRIVRRAAGKLGMGSLTLSAHLPASAPLFWTGTEEDL